MTARPSPPPGGRGDQDDADRYTTVSDGPAVELREKGSRFLARAFAAGDRATAQARVEASRRAHFDATHHCWALRLAPPELPLEVADDDGEPSGSAGAPIAGALRRARVCDALVLVVRWFGGVKLGTGGLVRAYGAAAAQALESAARVTVWRTLPLRVECSYDDVGAVEAVLARAGDAVRSVERAFAEHPSLLVHALASRAHGLEDALRDATGGRARITLLAASAPAGTSPRRTPHSH